MSQENLNNKGKAVVKEEVPPLTPVEGEPSFGVMSNKHKAMPYVPVAAPMTIFPGFMEVEKSRILLIKEVMQHCVAALDMGDVVKVNNGLTLMSGLASANGEPLQRVAMAFAEALKQRAMLGLSTAVLQPQIPQQPAPTNTIATRRCFYELCPFPHIAASITNHAIVTAMKTEKHVHVVDLGGASQDQWLDLLRLFAARPEGSPSLRLTVVSEEEGFLSCAAELLTQEARRLHIPFTFNPVWSHIDRFSPSDILALGVDHGEAMAITSTLQLHRLIADEITIELPADVHYGKKGRGKGKKTKQHHQITKADALLHVLCDLSPKLVVLTEQEADHNGDKLEDRVRNAFDYYAVLFNDLEASGSVPRDSANRVAVERLLLREEIMDIVARDGSSRRERHESMISWAQRMGVAGFEPAAHVMNLDAFADKGVLEVQFSVDGTLRYWAMKDDASFTIYSSSLTPMLSVMAWQPAKTDE